MEDDESKNSLNEKPLRKIESADWALVTCVLIALAPLITMGIVGLIFQAFFK